MLADLRRILCGLGLTAALAPLWAAPPAPPASAQPLPAKAAAASVTLERIARRGSMRVGYIPTPGTFAFRNAQGQTVGYSIDLCQRVIEAVKAAVGRADLEVQYVELAAAQRIPMLKAAEIDIECGGNTNTVARQREVDFSFSFFITGVRFVVRQPLVLDGPASLWRKRVAVSQGTTAEEVVQRLAREQQTTPVLVPNDQTGMRLLEQGAVDAFAQDEILLHSLRATSPQRDRLAVSGRFMTIEPYAFMLPKGDPVFRDLVDKVLLGLMRSGEIELIYRKWFDTPDLRVPLNAHLRESFRFPSRYGVP